MHIEFDNLSFHIITNQTSTNALRETVGHWCFLCSDICACINAAAYCLSGYKRTLVFSMQKNLKKSDRDQ